MKLFKFFSLVFFLFFTGETYAYTNIVRLALIDNLNFKSVGENLYISEHLSDQDEKSITAMLMAARKRITTHYGEPIAAPLIVVSSSQEEREAFGLYDVPGTLFFTPWRSYLVLNYQTANVDVAAHELVHAEVVERVGYLKRQFDIPTWFDEGVAMQVDYRPKYDLSEKITVPEFKRVISLTTPDKFWSHDKNQNVENYRSAKAAVFELFENTDESLYSLLSKIASGDHAVIGHVSDRTSKALVIWGSE
ncbi:MAG: hypothetical protein OIF57_18580 [Marinobacterium sp.]|nr:hypothetical protein [Marinobacterium sp.]